ncbi:MAG: sensor histidine kinase, partial [Chloroflexota bacterium]
GVLFNTSQFMLAVALAGIVHRALPSPLGVAAAAGTLYLANTVAVAVMAGLHQRRNPVTLWLVGRWWSLLQASGLLTLGFLTARAAAHDPWVPLIITLPAALTYVSLKRTEDAETAVRARDEFLRIASHELRTPLTSLRGHAQLLMRQGGNGSGPGDPERVRRAATTIDRQVNRLCGLMDQLLDVSRVEAGRLVLDRHSVDLKEIAEDVVAALQPITPQYRLIVRGEGPVPVLADRLRLEQVLTNLVTNATKYAGGGDRIELEVDEATDDTVRVAVRDYGVGIAPEHRERIFERFYQVPGAVRVGGLGIGLFVTRQIVERHGGTITVECPSDGGTRFAVTLPRVGGVVPDAPAGAPPTAGSGPDGPGGAPGDLGREVVPLVGQGASQRSLAHSLG